MLSGGDSAPQKANETKQKNDISNAQEDVEVTAINEMRNDGTYVIEALENKYSSNNTRGTATITVNVTRSGSTITGAKVTIDTRDYKLEGNVDVTYGDISWGNVVSKTQ